MSRLPIKVIRDYIKKDYKAKDCCYICGVKDKLELHHLYSVSELFSLWCGQRKIVIQQLTEEDMFKLRIDFAVDCEKELANEHLVTLCNSHHKRLHMIYGQTYKNSMAPKIRSWLEIQREKHGLQSKELDS